MILPQENPDVLLVALRLELLEEDHDAAEALRLGVEELVAVGELDLAPRHVHGDLVLLRELGERAPLVVVARLGPRIDRALAQRAVGVGNDERLVVLEHRAEAVTRRARAARIVEREELRRGRGRARAIVRALEALGVHEARHRRVVVALRAGAREPRGNRRGEQHHGLAVAIAERRAHRIREPRPALGRHGEAVDDHQELVRLRDVGARRQLLEMRERALDHHAQESLRAEILHDHLVCDEVAQPEREGDRESRALGKRKHLIGDGLHRVALHLAPAHRAKRVAHPRPEEPQEVVDLGGGAHGGARRLGGIRLLDRDGGGEPVDEVDGGLLHALEELPCVRRQRLHVSPLPLGVDRYRRRARTSPTPTGR